MFTPASKFVQGDIRLYDFTSAEEVNSMPYCGKLYRRLYSCMYILRMKKWVEFGDDCSLKLLRIRHLCGHKIISGNVRAVMTR